VCKLISFWVKLFMLIQFTWQQSVTWYNLRTDKPWRWRQGQTQVAFRWRVVFEASQKSISLIKWRPLTVSATNYSHVSQHSCIEHNYIFVFVRTGWSSWRNIPVTTPGNMGHVHGLTVLWSSDNQTFFIGPISLQYIVYCISFLFRQSNLKYHLYVQTC